LINEIYNKTIYKHTGSGKKRNQSQIIISVTCMAASGL